MRSGHLHRYPDVAQQRCVLARARPGVGEKATYCVLSLPERAGISAIEARRFGRARSAACQYWSDWS